MRHFLHLVMAAACLAAASQPSFLGYSTYLGGDGVDLIHAMAMDGSGNFYLTGETTSSNFPVTAGGFSNQSGQ